MTQINGATANQNQPPVSARVAASARKIHSLILRRLASVGQAEIAKLLNVHESTISRWKEPGGGVIEQVSRALAGLKLQVVPNKARFYDPKEVEMYRALAKKELSRKEEDRAMEWDAWEDSDLYE